MKRAFVPRPIAEPIGKLSSDAYAVKSNEKARKRRATKEQEAAQWFLERFGKKAGK